MIWKEIIQAVKQQLWCSFTYSSLAFFFPTHEGELQTNSFISASSNTQLLVNFSKQGAFLLIHLRFVIFGHWTHFGSPSCVSSSSSSSSSTLNWIHHICLRSLQIPIYFRLRLGEISSPEVVSAFVTRCVLPFVRYFLVMLPQALCFVRVNKMQLNCQTDWNPYKNNDR